MNSLVLQTKPTAAEKWFNAVTTSKQPATPFLKWVGGKSQLLPELRKYIPRVYNRYFEPFIGGGALFFNLAPQNAIISDSNADLINAYTVVRDKVEELIEVLLNHEYDETYYYKMRATEPDNLDPVGRAARLIYLNKTCFNGLYRVNKQGQFNVPFGRYSNPKICDADKLRSASKILEGVVIAHSDYQSILRQHAQPGDLIYIDPPYHPISEFGDFKRYTKEFFYEEDQIRLRDLISELKASGCYVIASNSYCDFILDLYKDFEIKVVNAKRYINKIAARRNGVQEIIIL